MFKDEADFEKVVGRLNIDTEPNPVHRQKLRRQMLSVFNQAEQKTATRMIAFRTLRSIIMKNTTTKIATAAAIILAVSIGLHFLGDGSSVAWSQVVEQLSNHTKYKCRQRVIREQGPQGPTMQVYHLNLQQRREEFEDGSIHIIDMRGANAITVQLIPDKKKAIVITSIGFGPKKDPDLIEWVKQFEQGPIEQLGTKTKNGKVVYGFKPPANKYNDFTIWVDADTKLPIEMKIKHPMLGQTIFMDEFEFDFDLEPSAFSTEIPDGYKVENFTFNYTVEPKEVTAEDIRTGLNHTAYIVKKLPWMEKLNIMQITDPLMKMGKTYVIGIQSNDGNRIIIVQGDYYDVRRMVWIPKETLVLETPSGIKLYTHPNGSEYARLYLESFAKVNPEFFNMENLSEERFTKMIVMPDSTILGLVANKQMSDEKLQQLVESLEVIKAN